MNKLSLCMIAKNEEDSLPKCLESVRAVCDEIIVVDTGSNDQTAAIGQQFGARVFHEPWQNDFARARNVSLDQARYEWIMWLDADDIVPQEAKLRIQKIKDEFSLHMALGWQIKNQGAGVGGQAFHQIRMFPNRPEIRFEYRVHEQVLPSIQRLGLKVAYTDIVILHTGYCSAEAKLKKQERNLMLLKQEIQDGEKDHPVILYMCGGALVDLGRQIEAVPYYERAYAAAKNQHREKHIQQGAPLALAMVGMHSGSEALFSKWIQVAEKETPTHVQLHFLQARYAEERDEYEKARDLYERVLKAEEATSFIPIDYRALKLQACTALGKLYGTIFRDKKRMMEVLDQAVALQEGKR